MGKATRPIKFNKEINLKVFFDNPAKLFVIVTIYSDLVAAVFLKNVVNEQITMILIWR